MRCPNCERKVGTLALSCRVCHKRLPFWYALLALITVAALAGIIFLLERV